MSEPLPEPSPENSSGDDIGLRILLTVLVAFGPLATDLYLPALPTLVVVFDTTVATVQLTLSVFMAGFALSQLVHGPLSDRFGRRPVIIGGLALFLLASIGCALATTVEQLIVARFFQALGGCAGPVVGRAVVRDVFGRDRAASVLAYMAMSMALAPAVAPLIGGALTQQLGWRSTFIFMVILGCGALLAAIFLLPESNRHRDVMALMPARLIGNYGRLLADRDYLGYTVTSSLVFSGLFTYVSGSPFLLVTRLGLSPTEYGYCFAVVVVGFIGGSFTAGRMTRRLGTARMIRLGTATAAAAGVLGLVLGLVATPNVPAIILPMTLFIFGAGLTMPNATAAAIANYPTMAGTASSLLGFVQMATAAVTASLIALLNNDNAVPIMAELAAAGLLAVLAARFLVRGSGP